MVRGTHSGGPIGYVNRRETHVGPADMLSADEIELPTRDIELPLRVPISNVFKGQSSGTGVSGRICGGIVQVGERVRVLPGDETAVVRCEHQYIVQVRFGFLNSF